MNRDTEETSEEDEQDDKSPNPRDLSGSPKEGTSGLNMGNNQNTPNGHKSSSSPSSSSAKASAKARSAININPFSGVLWERREPL